MNPCVAHRGWSGKAPENTMAAIKLAVDEPRIQWIEIDVQLSKDGVPVIIHDYTVNRTTTGNGKVKDHTLAQLRELDAGSWFNAIYAGEKIPTLDEVLRAVQGKCKLNIEIKTRDDLYPGIEEKVVELIRECQMQAEVMVTSFDHGVVKRVKELEPALQTGLIMSDWSDLLQERLVNTGASVISIDYHGLTKDFVSQMIKDGYKVLAWTVDDPAMMITIAGLHPELMLCTNHPDRLFGAAI